MWDEIPAKRVKQLKELKEWQTHFIGEQAQIQSASSSSVSKTSQL
jgi:hypothetical protein